MVSVVIVFAPLAALESVGSIVFRLARVALAYEPLLSVA